jgi:hypothetical protein
VPESESNNEMHGQSVQQDAISKCGHLERHHIGTCEMQAREGGPGTISTNAIGGFSIRLGCFFVGVLNECAGVVALEEGTYVHYRILQSGSESDVFVGE